MILLSPVHGLDRDHPSVDGTEPNVSEKVVISDQIDISVPEQRPPAH